MRYYSEEEVKRILYDIDYKWESLPQELEEYKHIEISEPHGRLIDADVIGNWLREQRVFSMPTTCKIDSIIKDAPTVLEASKEEE